jgi:protein-disulfide isomerase
MKRFYLILGVVAVIGIGAVGYSVGTNTFNGAASEPVEVEGLDDMERLVELAQGFTKGDENAPVTIVEFGDYQCPACGSFAMSVKPQVELGLVESGRAKFVFYDFPLVSMHQHAFIAARAARCAADQDKFWEYHDVLFRNQTSWVAEQSPIGSFVDYAENLGLDGDAFAECVRSDEHADVVSANMRLGAELGVSGTPTIIVNAGGTLRRVNATYAAIESVIEEMTAANPAGS